MTGFETASLVIAAANATAAVTAAGGIWHGIRVMVRANKDRAADARADRQATAEADERRHAEATRAADQRHAEAMAALNELIRAGQRQGEALERQGAALDELLRRPAQRPSPPPNSRRAGPGSTHSARLTGAVPGAPAGMETMIE